MDQHRSIVEVLALLRSRHPNLSISKIRLLEHEGRISSTLDRDGKRLYDPEAVSAAMPDPNW